MSSVESLNFLKGWNTGPMASLQFIPISATISSPAEEANSSRSCALFGPLVQSGHLGDPCPPGTRVASVWPHPRLTAGVALIQTAGTLSWTEYCLLPCLTNGGERAGHSCVAVASQGGRSLELKRKDENKMPAASISDFKREAGPMASWSLVPEIVGNKRPSGRQGQARAQSPIVRLYQQFSNFSY